MYLPILILFELGIILILFYTFTFFLEDVTVSNVLLCDLSIGGFTNLALDNSFESLRCSILALSFSFLNI